MEPLKQMMMVMFSIVALSLLAIVINPTFTGQVIKEDVCGPLGCFELCENNLECGYTEECCPAGGEGLCFYKGRCSEVTAAFKPPKTTVEAAVERPVPIDINLSVFFLILTVVFALIFAVKEH